MKQASRCGAADARLNPAAIAAAGRRYAPTAVRIGPDHLALDCAPAEGLPMVCLNARHAKKALDMKVNKTDANDAEGDHDAVDYPELCQTASLIVDTRNAVSAPDTLGTTS